MRLLSYTIALVLLVTSPSLAHTGHTKAPGSESSTGTGDGPIEVSEVAQRNLGLTVHEAELRLLETTLRVIGEIQGDPARSGTVSSRISGRVSAVYAQEGERVLKGKALVEIESLQLGDPPPRARYSSPVSGTVTDRHVVIGDDVEPNRHLFEVVDLSEVLAIGRVFEGQIGQVSVGQKVRVRVPSYPREIFMGVVERLGGKLDSQSRSLAVYVRIKNSERRLRPHMRSTLSLITGGADLALAIPKSAVIGESGNFFVFVQDEDRPTLFERRALVLGVSNDRYVEVIEGLYPGEPVVSEGGYSLQYLSPMAPDEKPEPEDVAGADDGHAHSHGNDPEGEGEDEGEGGHSWLGPFGLLSLVGLGIALFMRRRMSQPKREAR